VHGADQRSVLKRLWLNETAKRVVSTLDARLKLIRKIHLLSVRCKRGGGSIFAISKQDLHALFSLLQLNLALTRQLHAALELIQRLFQRQIATFQTGNDLL